VSNEQERQFPVLSEDRRKTPPPHSVPWAWIQQFERQAIENHDQDLEKLASRGGMGWFEIVCIMRGKKLRQFDALKDELGPTPADGQRAVLAAVDAWRSRQCTCSYEDSEEMTGHAPLCAAVKR